MYAPYGVKKAGGRKIPLSQLGCTAIMPPEPAQPASDKSSRCLGCPYTRHGMSCFTDLEACLRTDMAEIEHRSRNNTFHNSSASNPLGEQGGHAGGTGSRPRGAPRCSEAESPVISAEITRDKEEMAY